MNSDYKVGDLIYDANIYDGMNTSMDDLQFYKRWLPKNKDARILELCCGIGRLTLPIAKDGYDISGVDYTASMLHQAIDIKPDLSSGSTGGAVVLYPGDRSEDPSGYTK